MKVQIHSMKVQLLRACCVFAFGETGYHLQPRRSGKALFVIILPSAAEDSRELHEPSKENQEFSHVKTWPELCC